MADGYWSRQQQQQQQQQQLHPSAGLLKRPRRHEYDLSPSGLPLAHDGHNYLARDDRLGPQVLKDTKSIGTEYDRYLQNVQFSSYPRGEGSMYSEVGLERGGGGRMPAGGGRPAYSLTDPLMSRTGDIRHDLGSDFKHPIDERGRPGSETLPLPSDASNTLYIEGLPPNSTMREVGHIFRPFVVYKEVRLVTKDSKHRGRDPLVLCFVDFVSPACAATAMSAIQGYKMDEHDRDSAYLRLQFSKHPGPRSGGTAHRGRR